MPRAGSPADGPGPHAHDRVVGRDWRRATRYLGTRESGQRPHLYWSLGLAALLPAWLIAFVGLLGSSPTARPEASLSAAFISSSSAALLGILLSDAAVRRLRESGRDHPPQTYWLLGVAALCPAGGSPYSG